MKTQLFKHLSVVAVLCAALAFASCGEDKVDDVAVGSVALSQSSLSLNEGESATLTATVTPINATDKTVAWSTSNATVATVEGGRVVALKAGTATITAKAGTKSATCTVAVAAKVVAVESVTLDKTTLSMTEGTAETLTATVKPDNATDKTVAWSTSDAAIATVEGGKVTALKAGTATITATSGDKSASCAVTVAANVVAVESVKLNKTTLTLTAGDTETLTATVKPDNATDKTVAWSTSDEAIATVDGNGKVTAIKAGSATITATSGGKSDECALTVNAKVIPVESVTLDNATLDMKVGESKMLTATVSPDNADDKTVTWSSSDALIASVDKDGYVKALKAGTATITATAGDKSAECKTTVTNVALEKMDISPASITMKKGATTNLTINYTPANATNKSVVWTSGKPAIATVDSEGKVTAVATGVSQIIATSSENSAIKAVCNINVGEEVAGIMFVDGIYYQRISGSITDVEVTNILGQIGGDGSYSGDVSVPSTFVYNGASYTVKQIGHGAFRFCESLTSLTLPEGITSIGAWAFVGCEKLTSLTLPASLHNINLDNPIFEGCSKLEVKVASGSEYFVVTDGMLIRNQYYTSSYKNVLIWVPEKLTTAITIPDGIEMIGTFAINNSQSAKITIPASVKYLAANNFEACSKLSEVVVGWTAAQLDKLVYEKSDVTNAYFKGLVYSDITLSVPKGTKATYEAHGLWGIGFKIVEYDVPVTSISLNKTTLTLAEGESETLSATVKPDAAAGKTTWSTSDAAIATVDQNGKVTAIKAGSATITAKADDKSATCAVTVNGPVVVTGISLNKTTLTIVEGGMETLTATVSPADATDKTVTWSTSDAAIATVDQNGKVTAIKAGSATITAKAGDKSATCAVMVNAEGEISFADAKFKAAIIAQGFDKNGDGKISAAEAAAVTQLSVNTSSLGITSLVGIEYFINLTNLSCEGDESNLGGLTSLDLSKNTKLTYLDCRFNKLTSLDVSKCTALTDLLCMKNQLTALDVSKCAALTYLDCCINQLTTLDVSKNTALTSLTCYSNQLTTLDVSKNAALTYLDCFSNQLTSLDLSKNTKLTYLDCRFNKLTTLDVSNCTALIYLYCSKNQLTALDVSNNTALTYLSCENNKLTTLDVSKCTALTSLNCNMSTLTTLYMATGQVIKYINGTGDNARNDSYIYTGTTIVFK